MHNFTFLASRILVDNLKYFNENESNDGIGDKSDKSDHGVDDNSDDIDGIGDETDESDNGIGDENSKSIGDKSDTGDDGNRSDDDSNENDDDEDDVKMHCLLLGGDQFSTSMGQRVINDRINSTKYTVLKGLAKRMN